MPNTTKYIHLDNLSLFKDKIEEIIDDKINNATGNLATVATTGDYDDLSNKPVIPTVNYPVTDVQVNGTTVLNGTTAEITLPSSENAEQGGTTESLVTTGEKYIWNNKQDTLSSGTNIKTVNNESIVGPGNVDIGYVTYLTTAPSSDNTSGRLSFVILPSSVESTTTKYNGYFYIFTSSNA